MTVQNVSVVGFAEVTGTLKVTKGHLLSVSADMRIGPTSTLSITLTGALPQTILIATFASLTTRSTRATVTQTPFPNVLVESQPAACVEQTQTSTSLSVVISVGCGGGLSTGAMIGIIVGSVVGGLVLALVIGCLVCFFRKRRQSELVGHLKAKELSHMR